MKVFFRKPKSTGLQNQHPASGASLPQGASSRQVRLILRGDPRQGMVIRKKGTARKTVFYQLVLDEIAGEEKSISESGRVNLFPERLRFFNKLKDLCEAVEAGDAKEIARQVPEFIKEDPPVSAPYVIFDAVFRELVARMVVQGRHGEALKLQEWFLGRQRKEQTYTSPWRKYAEEAYLAETVVERATASLESAGADGALGALDGFIEALRWLRDRFAALDLDAVKEDARSNAEIAAFGGSLTPSIRHTLSGYYGQLVELMKAAATGTQKAFQAVLDLAVADLETGKGGRRLGEAKERLARLQGVVMPEGKLEEGKRIPGLRVEVTKSVFSEKKGRHLDIFLEGKAAEKRSIGIEYYEREMGGTFAEEKELPLGRILQVRRKQIEVLELLYGEARDKSGAVTAEAKENRELIDQSLKGRMRLHNNDDWRTFLLAKFRALEPQVGREKAFAKVIDLLAFYLLAFTTHTPYNIEDFGVNYLNRTFPRALTGQLIHDCGVYAIRIAYILSLVRTELDLEFRFVRLPLHVGLVITGTGLPAYVVHNDQFIPVSQAEMADLRKQWRETDAMGDPRKPAPLDERQFLGEVSASQFVPNVDIPFRIIDLPPPKGKPAEIKEQLWKLYTRRIAPAELFSAAIGKPGSPHYQFDLKYLELLKMHKEWFNETYVPFWNVEGRGIWLKHRDAIRKAHARLQAAAGGTGQAEAENEYQKTIAPYRRALDVAFQKVEDGRGKLIVLQVEISGYLAEHPDVLAKGARVSPYQRLDLGGWVTAWFWRYLSELMKGAAVEPPFAPEDSFLWPID
ncbi:hypothetical protein KJB29_12590 [Geobacter grbiciae]|nr:hypothetical protein [Geobacter grbiciae]MBT1076092.1 hypothetical protein [Geobacter grbiciae]